MNFSLLWYLYSAQAYLKIRGSNRSKIPEKAIRSETTLIPKRVKTVRSKGYLKRDNAGQTLISQCNLTYKIYCSIMVPHRILGELFWLA